MKRWLLDREGTLVHEDGYAPTHTVLLTVGPRIPPREFDVEFAIWPPGVRGEETLPLVVIYREVAK